MSTQSPSDKSAHGKRIPSEAIGTLPDGDASSVGGAGASEGTTVVCPDGTSAANQADCTPAMRASAAQPASAGEPESLDIKALLRVMAGAVMISFSAVFVNVLDTSPSASAFYRVFFGGIALLAVALWRKEKLTTAPVVLATIFGAGVFFMLDLECWHRSILYIGPGLATILGNFQVFFMAFVGAVFFREALSLRLVVALPLAIFGLWLLVGVDINDLDETIVMGVVFGLLTAVWYTGYILLLRRSQRMASKMPVMMNMALVSLCTAVACGASLLLQGLPFAIPDATNASYLIGYGVLCQGVGWLLLSSGLPMLPAAVAGLVMLTQPTLSFVWDVLFFGRPTGPLGLLGAAMAITAIWMGLSGQSAAQRKRALKLAGKS
ncbi:DMT family transporter [Oleidesulfovibrio sp.]|uniref:DMT family transporter n=1 Tax=Oleidesulfovibrio sp. TaxID=2909707 RepID=UPI003A85FD8F